MEDTGVNWECGRDILKFRKKDSHTYRDYIRLKTYGIDDWSYKKEQELRNDIGDTVYNIIRHIIGDSDKEILAAAKWYGRGLTVEDAIRKVLLGRKIEESQNQV